MRARSAGRLLPNIHQSESCIRSVYSQSSLYTHNLVQCVNDLHQIGLGRHHCLNRFVCSRSFIDHISVLPAFDTSRHTLVICDGKSSLCFATRHRTTRPVTTALETFRVTLAAND